MSLSYKIVEEKQETLPDPIEAIKFRMEQYEHNLTKASNITGISKSHLSEVLNRKRKLNLNQIRKLSLYGVPLKVLIQEYQL